MFIIYKLIFVISLQLNNNDGLPPYICVPCIQNLEAACNFVKKSEDSDKILRSDYVQNSYRKLALYE